MSRLVVMLAAVAAVLVWCTPASALLQRGHVFGGSFGAHGAGEGELLAPTDVAVDETSGEVYVVDGGGERVEVFRPGGGGYEFVSEFKVHSPGAIALDNSVSASDPSRGDVFVAGAEEKSSTERDLVYVYSPAEGRVVAKLHAFRSGEEETELEDISGVAVDAAGTLWVYWEEDGTIDGFSKALSKAGGVRFSWEPSLRRSGEIEGRFECSTTQGFAVAAKDEAFYTAYERENVMETCPGEQEEAPDSDAVAKLDAVQPVPDVVEREVDHQPTSGVAVDEASGAASPLGAGAQGDVYIDNESSVAAFTSAGVLIQRFGSGQLAGGSGMAIDAQTGDVFAAEPNEGRVDVFVPEEAAGAPVVDDLTAQALSSSSARLSAQIDPRGERGEYEFQYGTSDCVSDPASCATLPVPAGELTAGFGDQSVSVTVEGLQPAGAYYYRVLASNALGSTEALPQVNTFTTLPATSVLPDGRAWEMVSPPDKHGAAVELISESRGGSIQASSNGEQLAWLATGPVVSEPQGNRDLELTQLLSLRSGEGWSTENLETPHEQGSGLYLPSPEEYHYFTPDLSSSLVQPSYAHDFGPDEAPPLSPEASEKTMYVRANPPAPPSFVPLVTASDDTAANAFGGKLEFLDASSDLQHAVFESKVGLTAAAPTVGGLYEWSARKPASESLELVTVLPDGTPYQYEEHKNEPWLGGAGGLNTRGAISSDGSRVIWTEASEEGLYLRDTASGETIKLNAAQGNGATEPGQGDTALAEPGEGQQVVHYQSASSDGTRVFFTDSARLSVESDEEPVGEEPPEDLYEFELTSQPGQPLRGRLTDLTPDEMAGSADVLNLVPGSSEAGSSVYFVANGVLAPGASRGGCLRNPENEAPQTGTTCNLYVSQTEPQDPSRHETRFIAALSFEDASDWGAQPGRTLLPRSGNLASLTSAVSPDGRYLAFMSDRSLTGYDNEDASSQVSGERMDEEVFLYDSATGRLVCASCNPNQEEDGSFRRPRGVFDTEVGAEGLGLLVDRPEIWHERWLAGSIPGWDYNIRNVAPLALYQPRYLSDSGRLFFDSPDQLVSQATNGKEDVFEYEPEGVGSCTYSSGCIGLISSGTSSQESAFLDASENGDDVFFITSARLAPADTDYAYDIYDAHVCSESSPCASSSNSRESGCQTANDCRAIMPAQPVFQTPASATFQGPGNTATTEVHSNKTASKPKALTRAQKLALALKACRKLKRKHKRLTCERQARNRYGAHHKPKTAAKGTRAKPSPTSTNEHGAGGSR
jgi:WD40-like Beta Propeller Repeat